MAEGYLLAVFKQSYIAYVSGNTNVAGEKAVRLNHAKFNGFVNGRIAVLGDQIEREQEAARTAAAFLAAPAGGDEMVIA